MARLSPVAGPSVSAAAVGPKPGMSRPWMSMPGKELMNLLYAACDRLGSAMDKLPGELPPLSRTVKPLFTFRATAVEDPSATGLSRAEKIARGARPVDPVAFYQSELDGMYLGADGLAYPPDRFGAASVPGFLPTRPVCQPPPTTYLLGGFDIRLSEQAWDAQRLANRTGTRVVAIANAPGGLAQVVQTAEDRAGFGRSAPVDTTVRTLRADLARGRQVNIVGYSQGSAIISHALKLLLDPAVTTAAQRREWPRQLSITGIAGAGKVFPAGPRYRFYVNRQDPVPNWLGVHRRRTVEDGFNEVVGALPVLGPLNAGPRPIAPGAEVFTFDAPDRGNARFDRWSNHGFVTYLRQIPRAVGGPEDPELTPTPPAPPAHP